MTRNLLPCCAEISYYREKASDFDNLVRRHEGSLLLLQGISKRYRTHSYKFACFSGDFVFSNVQVHVTGRKPRKWVPAFRTHKRIRAQDPDLVWVHGLGNIIQVLHLRWTLGRKTKLIVQHHGERRGSALKRALLKFCSIYVDAFLFTSDEMAANLGLDRKKVHELMEGSTSMKAIAKTVARASLNIPQECLVYLWVGRLINLKNPLFFLRVFKAFAKQNPMIRLYLLYTDDTLLKESKSLCGDHANIVFVGRIPHANMASWYSMADYFVSASLHEGSGYALCEAMACHLPPLVPSIPSFRFMTNEGTCALLYESQNENSLRSALEHSRQINRTELQEKVRAQFEARLSYQALAKELISFFASL
ncbi:MAG TPA: glycosyltransferase family 4 protein [Bacteroidia bacterium]|nr:glycosyltransferase family 4 protein [Bacteroidia bacterium]